MPWASCFSFLSHTLLLSFSDLLSSLSLCVCVLIRVWIGQPHPVAMLVRSACSILQFERTLVEKGASLEMLSPQVRTCRPCLNLPPSFHTLFPRGLHMSHVWFMFGSQVASSIMWFFARIVPAYAEFEPSGMSDVRYADSADCLEGP